MSNKQSLPSIPSIRRSLSPHNRRSHSPHNRRSHSPHNRRSRSRSQTVEPYSPAYEAMQHDIQRLTASDLLQPTNLPVMGSPTQQAAESLHQQLAEQVSEAEGVIEAFSAISEAAAHFEPLHATVQAIQREHELTKSERASMTTMGKLLRNYAAQFTVPRPKPSPAAAALAAAAPAAAAPAAAEPEAGVHEAALQALQAEFKKKEEEQKEENEKHRRETMDLRAQLSAARSTLELFKARQTRAMNTIALTQNGEPQNISAMGTRKKKTLIVTNQDRMEDFTTADVVRVADARVAVIEATSGADKTDLQVQRCQAQHAAALEAQASAASNDEQHDRDAAVFRTKANLLVSKAELANCADIKKAAVAHLAGFLQRFTFLVDDPHSGPRKGKHYNTI